MTVKRQLHIGLSLTETWTIGNPPEPHDSERQTRDPAAFYIALSQAAEKACLDFVFKPDVLAMRRGLSGTSKAYIGLDVTIMLAAIAHATKMIGLVTTASTTFNPPYVVARQLMSLHWLSKGRAGWNIVTSIDGADNFSDAPMPSTDIRYQKAAEFTQVVRELWASYPHDALSSRATSAGPQPINHAGTFFSVKGPLNVAAHAAGAPPLFQAGASDIGREFAASVADATFASTPDMAAAIELRTDLHARAERLGRDADAVRVLPGLYFFLADTREEARELHRRAHAHLTPEHRHAALETILGLDITHLQPGSRVTPDLLPPLSQPVRSRTHADLLRRYIELHHPTVEELLEQPEVVGSGHWVSVGTVEDVLADIIAWFEAGAIDGFIALPGGSLRSLEIFLEQLVPALAERGLFRTHYEGETLRAHLGLEVR